MRAVLIDVDGVLLSVRASAHLVEWAASVGLEADTPCGLTVMVGASLL